MDRHPLFDIKELDDWNLDRLVKTESDKQAIEEGCYFDVEQVRHVLNFLHEKLSYTTIRYGKLKYPLLRWFVEDVVIPLFGWRKPNKHRRFKKLDAYVPKKNGKSTNLAAILVYLHNYAREGHHISNMALSKDQGGLIFREYATLIASNPKLASRFNIRHSWKLSTNEKTQVNLQTISTEAENKEGFNYWIRVYDEKHVSLDTAFVETLKYSGRSFPDPMELGISTAGNDINTVSYQDYTYSKQVLSGEVIDTSVLPVLYEIPHEHDADYQRRFDFEEYKKVNPSLGYLFLEEEFKSEFDKAMKGSLVDKSTWFRYSGNIWIEDVSSWLDVGEYDACHTDDNVKLEEKRGSYCYVGIDTTSRRDLCATAFFFPETLSVRFIYYLTQYSLDKTTNHRIKDNYRRWISEGKIRLISGNMIRYEDVYNDIMKYMPAYTIQGIGCDPYNAADLTVKFSDTPKYKDKFKTVKQTRQNISPAMNEVEDMILSHRLNCHRCPVFRHMLGNLRVSEDANGNKMPHKAKSLARIDGVSALLNAMILYIEDFVNGVYKNKKVQAPRLRSIKKDETYQ
jgi:phage terminase large subunit-like protein